MDTLTGLQHKLTTQYLNPNEIATLLGTNRDKINRLLTGDYRTGCEKKELKKGSFGYRIKPSVVSGFIELFKQSIEKNSQVNTKERKKVEGLLGMQEAISKGILCRNEWFYLKQYHLQEFFRKENPNVSSSPHCLIMEKLDDCMRLLKKLRVEKPEISQGSSRNTIRFR